MTLIIYRLLLTHLIVYILIADITNCLTTHKQSFAQLMVVNISINGCKYTFKALPPVPTGLCKLLNY